MAKTPGSNRAFRIRTYTYILNAHKSKQKSVDTRVTSSLQTGNGRWASSKLCWDDNDVWLYTVRSMILSRTPLLLVW